MTAHQVFRRMCGLRLGQGLRRGLTQLLMPLLITTPFSVSADTGDVLTTHKLAENAYALIGPLTNRNAQNLGNNANFGVLITDEGVVLIDPGATYKGAQMIDAAIRKLTDKPVTLVINTGGQDHRWLGNGYFKAQGARIIASEKAVADQKARYRDQFIALANLVGPEGIEGTEAVYADETFTDQAALTLGQMRMHLRHAGPAHTPGDSFVWLPEQRILFSGDIVYMDRMLSIRPQSAHRSWIDAFDALAALEPEIVVAGHGDPATLTKATADSRDYLVFLRKAIIDLMERGGGIEDVGTIDQSRFSYLANYDELKGRNAQRVYAEIEWE